MMTKEEVIEFFIKGNKYSFDDVLEALEAQGFLNIKCIIVTHIDIFRMWSEEDRYTLKLRCYAHLNDDFPLYEITLSNIV